MKIRNGFVSNSSSASFIVTWKTKYPNETLKETLCHLFGVLYEKENDKYGEYCEEIYEKEIALIEWVIKNTNSEESVNGTIYTTEDFTSMMNSYLDFDSNMAYFIMALAGEGEFTIINVK